MTLRVISHSLAEHLLVSLRDQTTAPCEFRRLARSLTAILITEATRQLEVKDVIVRTPLENTVGHILTEKVVLVPVLRAGLSMLDISLELIPGASVGYVGMERDEATAVAHSYYCKLPPLQGSRVLLLDPMLASGGSAAAAIDQLVTAGAGPISLLSVVAAPQGVERLTKAYPNLTIYAAALDRELNDRSFIMPGLGDFGDRLYGTV